MLIFVITGGHSTFGWVLWQILFVHSVMTSTPGTLGLSGSHIGHRDERSVALLLPEGAEAIYVTDRPLAAPLRLSTPESCFGLDCAERSIARLRTEFVVGYCSNITWPRARSLRDPAELRLSNEFWKKVAPMKALLFIALLLSFSPANERQPIRWIC
jgi:hypothetical protein